MLRVPWRNAAKHPTVCAPDLLAQRGWFQDLDVIRLRQDPPVQLPGVPTVAVTLNSSPTGLKRHVARQRRLGQMAGQRGRDPIATSWMGVPSPNSMAPEST
jgi:hypothetical protein